MIPLELARELVKKEIIKTLFDANKLNRRAYGHEFISDSEEELIKNICQFCYLPKEEHPIDD